MISAKRIELWQTDRLVPYARNARTHGEEQIAKIAASIAEFGFTNPILVDSNDGIIAGHGRLEAAKLLGLPEVPVIVLDHLTDAQRRAYVLADNRLAEDSGWDNELLAAELAELQTDDFNLDLVGFKDYELEAVFAAGVLPEPEAPGQPREMSAEKEQKVLNDAADRYLVLVECENEEIQQTLFNELNNRGMECKLMS